MASIFNRNLSDPSTLREMIHMLPAKLLSELMKKYPQTKTVQNIALYVLEMGGVLKALERELRTLRAATVLQSHWRGNAMRKTLRNQVPREGFIIFAKDLGGDSRKADVKVRRVCSIRGGREGPRFY